MKELTDKELKEKINKIVSEKLYHQAAKGLESAKIRKNNEVGRATQHRESLKEPLKMLPIYEEFEKNAIENFEKAEKDLEEIEGLISEYEKRFNKKTNIETSQHKDNVNCYNKRY